MMDDTCKYKILDQSEIGSVSACKNCRNLKIEIGSLLALISRKSFIEILDDFLRRRAQYLEDLEEDMAPDRVIICLNNNNLFLNMTPNEFDDLIDLFELSAHMLEVDEIFDLTE